MAERRYFWVFERNPFDVIRLPEFTPLEGILIVGSLVALGLYLMLIAYLDSLSRRRARRAKRITWLERWLEHLQMNPHEEASLDILVGGSAPMARYELLSSPARLELRLHEAISEGKPINHPFAKKLRNKLGYTSRNLRVPVVSTRQLVIGDPVRISFSAGGTPHHYYGKLVASGGFAFVIEVHPGAVEPVAKAGGIVDLFYIRALGLEYPFAHAVAQPTKEPGQLTLRHLMARQDHMPRAARLPLMLEVNYRTPVMDASPIDELDPDAPRPIVRRGLLLDLSTGGFCLGHEGELQPGQYVEFRLPLKKLRGALTLTGRVKDGRPFTGAQWLSRCELRGLDSAKRRLLSQILRTAQTNRFRMPGRNSGNGVKAG